MIAILVAMWLSNVLIAALWALMWVSVRRDLNTLKANQTAKPDAL